MILWGIWKRSSEHTVLGIAEVAMGRWMSNLLGRNPCALDLGIAWGFHLVRHSCCVGGMALVVAVAVGVGSAIGGVLLGKRNLIVSASTRSEWDGEGAALVVVFLGIHE
jgi:hypothetical protein